MKGKFRSQESDGYVKTQGFDRFGPLGGVIPYVQFMLLVYLALVYSRGLQTVERGMGVPSL